LSGLPQRAAGAGLTRFAARGGHRLSYEVHGEPDAPPVLVLHDLLADRGQVRPLAIAPEAAGVRLILPDGRGHGASPSISGRAYPVAELAADALAVLDAEGVGGARVAAMGWAAATALALTLAEPGRVSSLLLADPYLPALLATHPAPEARAGGATVMQSLEEAAGAGEKGQIDRALELVLGARLGPDWRERMPRARQGAARRSAANLAPLLRGLLAEPLSLDDLRRVAVPVTVLVAADSSPAVRGTGEVLAAQLPRMEVRWDEAAAARHLAGIG
jgi:pimeloyl-ACP methyl ester carboxylesterase